jgi:hypothetical protein
VVVLVDQIGAGVVLADRDVVVVAVACIELVVTASEAHQKEPVCLSNSRSACLDRSFELFEEEQRRDPRSIRAAAEVVADAAFQNWKKTLYASSPADPSCLVAWTPRS